MVFEKKKNLPYGVSSLIDFLVVRKDIQMKNLIRKKTIFSTTPNLYLDLVH